MYIKQKVNHSSSQNLFTLYHIKNLNSLKIKSQGLSYHLFQYDDHTYNLQYFINNSSPTISFIYNNILLLKQSFYLYNAEKDNSDRYFTKNEEGENFLKKTFITSYEKELLSNLKLEKEIRGHIFIIKNTKTQDYLILRIYVYNSIEYHLMMDNIKILSENKDIKENKGILGEVIISNFDADGSRKIMLSLSDIGKNDKLNDLSLCKKKDRIEAIIENLEKLKNDLEGKHFFIKDLSKEDFLVNGNNEVFLAVADIFNKLVNANTDKEKYKGKMDKKFEGIKEELLLEMEE